MPEDDKTPAREIITDYAQAHFRYFRTADGTVYAQRNGHPVSEYGLKSPAPYVSSSPAVRLRLSRARWPGGGS
jgi:hypothetical protein